FRHSAPSRRRWPPGASYCTSWTALRRSARTSLSRARSQAEAMWRDSNAGKPRDTKSISFIFDCLHRVSRSSALRPPLNTAAITSEGPTYCADLTEALQIFKLLMDFYKRRGWYMITPERSHN